MRKLHTLAAALTIASVGVTGAAAQGKGNAGAPKAPKAPTTTVSHGNAGTPHGAAPNKGPGSGASKTGTTSASNATAGSSHGGGAGAGKGNGKITTEPVAPPNALSTKLSQHPQQLARLTAMLPEGMTLEQATTGFRNQGQFIAALNASKNQGVSFADLQTAMTVDGLSLGQAVKQLRNAPPAPDAPEAPATGGTTTPMTTSTTTPSTQKSS